MADHEELELTTTKRARWSSESSCDQNESFLVSNEKEEPDDGAPLRSMGSEQNISVENLSSEIASREQHGDHVSHERLESNDFPTCFSVEDDLDHLDEHHFQPIAGNKRFCFLKSSGKLLFAHILRPPFCLSCLKVNVCNLFALISPKSILSAKTSIFYRKGVLATLVLYK